jgi:hypothetical protein
MSVAVTYAIICDGCGVKFIGFRKSPGLAPHLAYNIAKKKIIAAKWVTRNCGSKGDKHYCYQCVTSEPELAQWHMQKILTK